MDFWKFYPIIVKEITRYDVKKDAIAPIAFEHRVARCDIDSAAAYSA